MKPGELSTSYRAVLFVLVFLGLVLSCPLQAGADDNATSNDTSSLYRLDPVVVTSEKHKQDLQKTASSISALSDVLIEDANILSVTDIGANVPNLFVNPSGGSRYYTAYSIRGIGSTTVSEPAVGLYVDGVPYSDEHSYNSQLYEIEQIEVLRGPQAVLYGKNTQAGIINITTQQPGNEVKSKFSVGYGNYNSQDYRASVSGPIVEDELFFGLSAMKASREGFLENTFLDSHPDDRDDLAARARMVWTPLDNLKMDLVADWEKNEDGAMVMTYTDQDDPYETAWDYDGFETNESNSQSLRIEYTLPFMTISSVTAHRQWGVDFMCDYDYSAQDIAQGGTDEDEHQWTQEFRFQSPEEDEGPLKWLVGAYYGNKTHDLKMPSEYGALAAWWGKNAGADESQDAEMTHVDYALFGQATYTIWDDLRLTAGLRLSYEEKEMERTHWYRTGGATTLLAPDMDLSDEWFSWAPKFAVSYDLNKDAMLYASVAKGFKSGGFCYAEDDPELAPYDQETSWNYELGAKTSWLDDRLVANAAVFYSDIRDQQVKQATGAWTVSVVNAEKSTVKGFEIDLKARPVQGLDIMGGFGYADTEYVDFIDPFTGIDYSGNHHLNVPAANYNLAAQYRALGFMARVEYTGSSDIYFNEGNNEKESYSLVNGKLGYEIDNFGFYVWAKNLLDEEYYLMATASGTRWMGAPGEPRTFGAGITWRF